MASWRDGPEYAPLERPAGFAMPRVEPLEVAPPAVSPAAGAPVMRPQFTEPQWPVPELAALAPAADPTRDGRIPFSVASMTMTQQTSAWGAAHSSVLQPPGSVTAAGGFDPTRPFRVAGADPRAALPGGFAPPSGTPVGQSAPPSAPPQGVSFRQAGPIGVADVWRELTPGVVIGLGIGCFLPFLSLVVYGIAFAFATRVRIQKALIRYVFIGGSSLLGLVAAIALFTGEGGFADWWMALGWWALVVCWLTLATCVLIVYRALTGGRLTSTPF